MAPGADLRTDVPRYRIWRDGELVDEPTDASEHWRDDLVAFLIGCSFTFERALLAEGLPIRHVEQGVNVPMYRTSVDCTPAGRFSGPLVVSMRPMTPEQAIRATQITSRYTPVHGAPVHVGDPAAIGIADLGAPDYGDAGRGPRRRAAGVLGLRRDAPGGRGRLAAGADDHPRPGPHVRHRRARRDDGDALTNVNGGWVGSGFEPPRRPRMSPRPRSSARSRRHSCRPRPKPDPYPAAVRQSSRAAKGSSPSARRPGTQSSPRPWSPPPRNDVPSNTSAAASSAA